MGVHPLLREPWAITADGLRLAVSVASRGEYFHATRESALAARNGKPLENTRSVEMRDNVAIIPVDGVLFRHADLLTEISGGVSYATLRKDLQTALDSDAVQGIMLAIDSPGGEVNGLAELAAAVYAARSQKPIVAYVSDMGCSAAYWLASAAERIVCSPTAQLGSIGVVTAYVNDEAAQKERAETIEIRSSGAPNKNPDPTTSAGRDLIQERLDAIERVFHTDVARYRGVDAQTVSARFGKGGVLVGQDAVKVGMADAIGSYESTLSDVSKRGAAAQTKRTIMAQDQERLAAFEAFERDVLAIAGATDRAAALGALRGMKAAHEQSQMLSARVTQLEADKRSAEFDALVKQGRDSMQITPALAKSEWIAGLRAREDGVAQLKAFLASAPKVVGTASEQPREPAPPTADDEEITALDIKMARVFCGNDEEAVQKRLEELRAMRIAEKKRSAA